MRLRGWFIILILLLGLIFVLLTLQFYIPRTHLFYFIETVGLITIIYSFFFYRRVIQPIQTIGNGMELLKEQDFSSRLRKVNQADADRIVDVFNRMMAQLKEERLRVREQNNFLDLLIQASPMGVVILDFNERITQLNPAAEKFLDSSINTSLIGKKLSELQSTLGDDMAIWGKNTVDIFQLNDSHIYRCSRLSFVDHGFTHPFLLIESLTDEVMKAEKKAYEKVIRMIAHEVNNTTAGVTSTLDTVITTLKDFSDNAELCEVMRVCIERCYSMSDFITKFADVVKIPEPQLQRIDLNDRLGACLTLMESVCADRHIRLHKNFYPSSLFVMADSSLLEQVIMNIVKNSAESIGEDGDLYITTSLTPTMLEIADTGAGISKEVEKKLFSPFFSTKPNGQGIGLIFIREVLNKHGFNFSLKTYEDGLTRFRIFF